MGKFLRDVMRNNADNFRVFGPDETSFQPARCAVRGDRPRLDGRALGLMTIISRPMAG